MHHLSREDIRSIPFEFLCIYGLLMACLLTSTKDLSSLGAPVAIAVMAAISAIAVVANLVTKIRRRQKGISDLDVLRRAQMDVRLGRTPLSPTGKRWPLTVISILASIIGVAAGLYFGNLPT